jgi:hypothetical protein
MSTTSKSSDELVDKFVRYANETGFESRSPDEVPEDLRTSDVEHGMFHWQIRPVASNPWIEQFVQQLPQALPRPYLSLVQRYRFCDFTVGPVMFFANSGQDLSYELSKRVFKDKRLFPTLHKRGYLEFGKPEAGSYDPICFDTSDRDGNDAPVVRLDHEAILMRNRIRVVQEIASSFADFIRSAVIEKLSVR